MHALLSLLSLPPPLCPCPLSISGLAHISREAAEACSRVFVTEALLEEITQVSVCVCVCVCGGMCVCGDGAVCDRGPPGRDNTSSTTAQALWSVCVCVCVKIIQCCICVVE